MPRRKKVEEHINNERWLVSYADFITLLFSFFVVMYSISSVNEGKYRVLSDTLEGVFADVPRSFDPIQIGSLSRGKGEKTPFPGSSESIQNILEVPPIELPSPPISTIPEETIKTIDSLSQQLDEALSDLIADEDVIIKKGEDWLELEIKSKVLFGSGDSRLGRGAIPVIGKVASILNTSANPVQVEGFTDNNPINTPKFPSNWELSAARAASVVHLLDRYGVDPDRMSAIGYGEFQPIASNDTEEGRRKNRRVVLVVLGSKDKSRRSLDAFDTPEISQSTPATAKSDSKKPTQKPVSVTP